jgi:Flp pilus assembly pilin Flp
LKTLLKKFINCDEGLETAEKAALTVIGVTIAVGAMMQIAPPVKSFFTKIAQALTN